MNHLIWNWKSDLMFEHPLTSPLVAAREINSSVLFQASLYYNALFSIVYGILYFPLYRWKVRADAANSTLAFSVFSIVFTSHCFSCHLSPRPQYMNYSFWVTVTISPIIYAFWVIAECSRLTLGYYGNLQERVPSLYLVRATISFSDSIS
jgi:hypothetical protein